MTIAPHLFEAFLKCPTKCHLRSLGETGSGNEYAEWVRAQDEGYEREAVRRLQETVPEAERTVAPPAENLKATKWRLAVAVVAQASPPASSGSVPLLEPTPGETPGPLADGTSALRPDSAPRVPSPELETRFHAIERIPSEGRGKAAQFIPIRFIYRNKLTKDDKLLLAFDAFVLGQSLRRDIALGKIIHGDDHATHKVKTAALAGEVRKGLEKIAALLTSERPPDLILNRHCAECEFRDRCRQKAIETDDLSLLAGMSAKERQKLRSKGIFTVTQLSYTFRPRRRPKRQRDKREKYHHSLKALAIREKKIHIVGSPELKIEGTPVYLDVEGLPDRDFYYLIGLRIGHGDTAVQHSLWADTVADEGTIWREFLAILETVEKPVVIYYGSYETTFFKRMRERYGGLLKQFAAARAISSSLNLLSFIFAQVYFPAYSNGLKEIGAMLGVQWQSHKASGLQSVVWRRVWESARDESMKRSLLAYNQDDCHALCKLATELIQIAENAHTLPNVDFANSPKKSTTENGAEVHAIFARMLKSAHADYDRSHIRFRSVQVRNGKPEGRRVRISPLQARKFSRKRGSIIMVSPKRTCPRHPKEPLQPTGQLVERWLVDLSFTRNGVRKKTTGYLGKQTVCPTCKVKFSPPIIRRLGPRIFGHSFQAWAVYQRVALRMPLEAISKTMFDLFSEDINRVTVMDFMGQFAAEYARTEKRLLERILSGPVIHADETTFNIHGENHYVWVLTSGSEVIFRLSPTRETGLIQVLIRGYQGTLVSDFYGGYDAVPCRQQKCLVHLIRDLNEDLWKHPYNDDYNQFTMAVHDLLVPMLDDVHRFGLKVFHLKKHKCRVDRFYREYIDGHSSFEEPVAKYKKRFDRYRESLFTFLEHDGVPWNNNAAERAIRHLAVQRKISGAFSIVGANRYLRLLAIAQTCRFQEKSFLGFLLSGLKDVDAFAESRRGRRRRSSACRSPVIAATGPCASADQPPG